MNSRPHSRALQRVNLSDVLLLMRNGTSAPQMLDTTNYPVTRIETISDEEIDYSKVGYLRKPEPKYQLTQGDVLFSHINSTAHIGKSALYSGDYPLWHGMNLMLLRPDPRAIDARYLAHFLKLPSSRAHAQREAKPAINQASLAMKQIGSLPIHLPSLDEQRRIADILDTLDDQIRAAEQVVTKSWLVWEGVVEDIVTSIQRSSPLIPIAELASVEAGEWGLDATETDANAWVLRSTNINGRSGFNYDNAAPRRIDIAKVRTKRLAPGDIALEGSGGGPGVPVGRVALFEPPDNREYLVSNFFKKIRPHGIKPYLLWIQLDRIYRRPKIWAYQQQTTGIINLKTREYVQQKIAVPDPDVQQYFCEKARGIRIRIEREERLLAKLRLLKQGLMSDLLTGRVQVPLEAVA